MDLSALDLKMLDSGFVAVFTAWGMRIISAIAILISGWIIGRWLSRSINNIKKLDPTLKTFLGGLLKYGMMAVAFVAVLAQLGVQTASLLAVLGAAGLAIGLALQGTLSNVAAGVMLLILRPFNVGDFIECGHVKGTIRALGLFGTEISTLENIFVFVPNSQIWQSEIFNFSRNIHRRIDLEFGISYSDDIDKAFAIINQVLAKEPRLIDTKDKAPQIFVNSLADSSVNIIARIWVKTSENLEVRWDLTKAIKEAFDKSGITIPFPTQIALHYEMNKK